MKVFVLDGNIIHIGNWDYQYMPVYEEQYDLVVVGKNDDGSDIYELVQQLVQTGVIAANPIPDGVIIEDL